MNKLKSHRGASKRFKITAGGVKFRHSNRSHNLSNKSPEQKRRLRAGGNLMCASNEKMARGLLNGSKV